MGPKTKIIVLHMKEIIYTAVIAALFILLILLLAAMFSPKKPKEKEDNQKNESFYTTGVYSCML